MKKIIITNNVNNKIFKNVTETEELATQWVNRYKHTFGLPERLVPQTDCTEEQLASALELIPEVLDEAGEVITPAMAKLPAEYTIEIEDITAQVEQQRINAEALAYLASTDFKVLRHIRQKALGEELSLSEQEYLILEQQRSDAAKRIFR